MLVSQGICFLPSLQNHTSVSDGACLLFPAMHASVSMETFPLLSAIISHACLVARAFPDRIAFPCLAAALLRNNTVVPDTLLQECFVSSLSAHEASILRDAGNFGGSKYPPSVQAELVCILGCHGCREAPHQQI